MSTSCSQNRFRIRTSTLTGRPANLLVGQGSQVSADREAGFTLAAEREASFTPGP
jgi:hypothetical protein